MSKKKHGRNTTVRGENTTNTVQRGTAERWLREVKALKYPVVVVSVLACLPAAYYGLPAWGAEAAPQVTVSPQVGHKAASAKLSVKW
jgi:hypothetical protein